MNRNGEKNEVSEQNLEQVSGGTVWGTALYRCPVCHREQTRTTLYSALPAECACPCGAQMKIVNGTKIKFGGQNPPR